MIPGQNSIGENAARVVMVDPITGYATSIYYIIGYVFMNLACFLVICQVSQNGNNVAIDDLTGLHKRAPLLALTLTIGKQAKTSLYV